MTPARHLFPASLALLVALPVGLITVAVPTAAPAAHPVARTTVAHASAGGRHTGRRHKHHNQGEKFRLTEIHHVFDIVLENETYSGTFGDPSADPYLAKKLPSKGLLLSNYYGTGHESNDNYVSLVSGQAPNSDNQSDCQKFSNFPTPGTVAGEPDQQLGDGCVYPASIGNLGRQLSAKHLSWKGYMQDMGNNPSRESAACGHPGIGSQDNTESAVQGDGYATRHDPFVYFHSVIDNHKYCDTHVQALGKTSGAMPKHRVDGVKQTGLATDLRHAKSTPAYSFITPNLCNDGHDYPCKNQKGGSSAAADIDSFLRTWVPKIMRSTAYRRDGLIEITFDESDGPQEDSTSCCNEQPDPNAAGGLPGISGPGGGKVGAVLLSPFIKPGTTNGAGYNHYSTLRTNEKIFKLPPLGYAQKVHAFSTKLFRRLH